MHALLTRLPSPLAKPALLGLLVLAGCCITLSLAPFYYWPLALLGLFLLHQGLEDASGREALLRSFVFGCGMFVSGCYWVYVSMNTYGGASPLLAGFMTAVFCLFLACLLMPFAWFYTRYLSRTHSGRTLGFAALWLLSEWLRTWLLTGFPWLFIGYSQTEGPLASWAPVISTLGLSLLLAYTAAVLSENAWGKQRHARRLSLAVVLVIWLSPLLLQQIEWTHNRSDRAYKVALLQPNIDLKTKWDPAYILPGMLYFQQTTYNLKDQDLIIWPETALARRYHQALDYLAEIDQHGKNNNYAVILGVPSYWYSTDGHGFFHNTLVAIGKGDGIYHKQKLVPFGEYVPLERELRGLIEFFDLPMSSFREGPAGQPALTAQGLNIMPYICYEVVYPDFVAATAGSADLLLTVSNDAWFGTSIGPIQHLQMAQMRALENGRYMLRDTNNGVTAVIDPQGHIIARLPQFEREVLKAEVYAREGLTPVARYGTLPAVIFSAVAVIALLLLHRRMH